MYRTKEEKQNYIDKIFNNIALFEWEVLHVSSHYDRLEIMQILAQTIVHDKLKYETNFLYLEKYEDFKLSQIVNILFHEIANEWLSFATEVLHCKKEDIIEDFQDKRRIYFIHHIVKDYYKKYRHKIFEVIADSFIDLIRKVTETNKLIDDVLRSNLIRDKQILEMHNFAQLWGRVLIAQNKKNSEIISANIKIFKIKDRYGHQNISKDEKYRLLLFLKKSAEELEELKLLKLDNFDSGVKRLKETMVNSMLGMEY